MIFLSYRWEVYANVCYDIGVKSGQNGETSIPEENESLNKYLATLPLFGDYREVLTNSWIEGYEYGDDLRRG